jgi:hypothetical protein
MITFIPLTSTLLKIYLKQGKNLNHELDSLHGQATVLASLVAISPKLLLGYPARFISLYFLMFLGCNNSL